MSAEQEIEEVILKAKEAGIAIVRGPVFIWGGRWTLREGYLEEPILKGFDAFGAMLWFHKLAEPIFLKGIDAPPNEAWKKIYSILGKDQFWWHRFRFGWNQIRSLQLYTETDGKRKYFDDSVSASGASMSKKFTL